MFFEFLDMFIHQWETKEDYDCVMQMQEQEDWEAFKANNAPKEAAPAPTGIFASAAFANLQKVAGGNSGVNKIQDL